MLFTLETLILQWPQRRMSYKDYNGPSLMPNHNLTQYILDRQTLHYLFYMIATRQKFAQTPNHRYNQFKPYTHLINLPNQLPYPLSIYASNSKSLIIPYVFVSSFFLTIFCRFKYIKIVKTCILKINKSKENITISYRYL